MEQCVRDVRPCSDIWAYDMLLRFEKCFPDDRYRPMWLERQLGDLHNDIIIESDKDFVFTQKTYKCWQKWLVCLSAPVRLIWNITVTPVLMLLYRILCIGWFPDGWKQVGQYAGW